MNQETENEVYDLNLIKESIEKYKINLEKNERLENEEQKILRLTVESAFNNWVKYYSEW